MITILYCNLFEAVKPKLRVLRREDRPVLYVQLHISFKKEAERYIKQTQRHYEGKVELYVKTLDILE